MKHEIISHHIQDIFNYNKPQNDERYFEIRMTNVDVYHFELTDNFFKSFL